MRIDKAYIYYYYIYKSFSTILCTSVILYSDGMDQLYNTEESLGEIKKCLVKLARDKHLKNVNIRFGNYNGLGVMGFGINVKLSGFKDGKFEEYNIYAKTAATAEEDKNVCPIKECFKREIFAYERVIPILEEILNELDMKSNFVKYYMSTDECILLEMLDAYSTIVDIKVNNAEKEIKKAIQIIGKLHGLSFVLKSRNPEYFCELENNLKDIYFGEAEETAHSNSLKNLIDLTYKITNRFLEGDLRVANEMIGKRAYEMYKEAMNYGEYKVISHGDAHMWNFLFKYKDNKIIEDSKVVDFQFLNIASPAIDFQYLIGCTSSAEQRQNHHTTFRNLHFGTMSEIMKKFNLDIQQMYPRIKYEKDLERTSIIAISKANQSFAFSMCKPESLNLKDFFLGIEPGQFRDSGSETRKYVNWVRENIKDYITRYTFL